MTIEPGVEPIECVEDSSLFLEWRFLNTREHASRDFEVWSDRRTRWRSRSVLKGHAPKLVWFEGEKLRCVVIVGKPLVIVTHRIQKERIAAGGADDISTEELLLLETLASIRSVTRARTGLKFNWRERSQIGVERTA